MLGHGQLQDLDVAPMPRAVKLFDLNPREGFFGPEVGFAYNLLELMPLDELWLLKYAVGGTSLYAWIPDWSAERAAAIGQAEHGPLYQRLMNHFQQVTQGAEVDVIACLWMQGESDSRHEVAAAQYERNLKRLVSSLCHDLNQPDMPFIAGLVNPPSDVWSYVSVVRNAQRKVAQTAANVCLVETDGLSKLEDDLHYDSAGQLELGRRFAVRLYQHLGKTSSILQNPEH
ncbi:MAG: hypothetical protein OXG60_12845, partial [Chloroflexi bacterium]|nr:hypothetical protein [Chloroflexota bacterium]